MQARLTDNIHVPRVVLYCKTFLMLVLTGQKAAAREGSIKNQFLNRGAVSGDVLWCQVSG